MRLFQDLLLLTFGSAAAHGTYPYFYLAAGHPLPPRMLPLLFKRGATPEPIVLGRMGNAFLI